MTSYIIYKIVHKNDESLMYIGSTTNFKSRANHHRLTCSNPKYKCYDMHLYQVIREHGGWENWEMSPLEVLENSTKKDAAVRQQDFIYELNPSLNKYNAHLEKPVKVETEERELSPGYLKKKESWYKWYNTHQDDWKEHNKKQNKAKRERSKEKRMEYHNTNRAWKTISADFRRILIADHVQCHA